MTQINKPDAITIVRPDDWHIHLRDGEALRYTVPHAASQFSRAIVMPNLKPSIMTVEQAIAYRIRILDALPEDSNFTPLMTLYLTDNTTSEEIARAKESGIIQAVKFYPRGATTNSGDGVTDISRVRLALEAMQYFDIPLLLHGEVTDPAVDIFDREEVYIENVLIPLLLDYPGLRVVMEHITTQQAAEFVRSTVNVSATITAHHLLYNRNAIFQGGVNPHKYCLPILKREIHRLALMRAATSGSSQFFLGSDSAPHAKMTKEAACGCAGCYTAYSAIELYAEAFDSVGALDKLEGFASFYGPDFYGLPRNSETIRLVREDWTIPKTLPYIEGDTLIPLRAGENICWKRT